MARINNSIRQGLSKNGTEIFGDESGQEMLKDD